MNLPKLLKLAREASLRSDHHSHLIGCVIADRKGRVISAANNFLYKTHPKYAVNSLKTLHAEGAAILKTKHKDHLHGSIILTYRELQDGTMANARPCPDCMKLIKLYGIKKIYYTKDNQLLEEIL